MLTLCWIFDDQTLNFVVQALNSWKKWARKCKFIVCVLVLSRCLLYFVGNSQFWISIFATSVSVCTVILDRRNFFLENDDFVILCWLFVDWLLNFCWPSRNFYGHRNFYHSDPSFDLGKFLKFFDFLNFFKFPFF